MSYSSIYAINNTFYGTEIEQFENSWLFSPIVWEILANKYISELSKGKILVMSIDELFKPLNKKINSSNSSCDRICWELSNQQIFFTKDKNCIAENIRDFVNENRNFHCNYMRYDNTDYLLQQEHIQKRFSEIANAIKNINEERYPYFVLKGNSVDDGVANWFLRWDDEKEESYNIPLSDKTDFLAEFVVINNNKIEKFISNQDFFNSIFKE